MESITDMTWVLFVVAGIVIALVFIFVILLIFSSKVRGKIMEKQIKAVDTATTNTKENIENIAKNTSGAIETTTEAVAKGIKKGFDE